MEYITHEIKGLEAGKTVILNGRKVVVSESTEAYAITGSEQYPSIDYHPRTVKLMWWNADCDLKRA